MKTQMIGTTPENKEIILCEFKRKFKCTRISGIDLHDIDWFEQDLLVTATIHKGSKRVGRKTLYFQFNGQGVVTP